VLLLAVADLPASGSLVLTILGAVAVVAVLGLAVLLVISSVGGGARPGER
jgi:ABC-type multidrug transport system permease subunit